MIEMQYEFVATFSINHLSLHIGIRVTNTVLFMVWVMFGDQVVVVYKTLGVWMEKEKCCNADLAL